MAGKGSQIASISEQLRSVSSSPTTPVETKPIQGAAPVTATNVDLDFLG